VNPCSLVKRHQKFGEIFSFHLQGWWWRWNQYEHSKHWTQSTWLHYVTSQKTTTLHSLLQLRQTSHLTVCISSCTTCSWFWVHLPWCFTRITKVSILVTAVNCFLCSWWTKSPHSARYRRIPQQDTHQTAWIQPRKWHRLRKNNRGKLWLLVIRGFPRKGKLNSRLTGLQSTCKCQHIKLVCQVNLN
jgi:hypothetical protein